MAKTIMQLLLVPDMTCVKLSGLNSGFGKKSIGSKNKIAILFVLDGSILIRLANDLLKIRQSSTFVINTTFEILEDGDVRGWIVELDAACLDPGQHYSMIVNDVLSEQHYFETHFRPEAILAINSTLQHLKRELESQNTPRREIVKQLLHLCLLFTFWDTLAGRSDYQTRENQIYTAFTELVQRQAKSKRMVADYAGLLFISPAYLNQVVKKISGKTASQHIQQHIIESAKKKALFTKASMKQIAIDLGFESSAHFSKFFKNNSGKNFSSFKKTSSLQ